jgi:hypothetical protein
LSIIKWRLAATTSPAAPSSTTASAAAAIVRGRCTSTQCCHELTALRHPSSGYALFTQKLLELLHTEAIKALRGVIPAAAAAPTSAALCSLLGSLLRGALPGKLLALGLVAPIPVSALAHGATVAHAQAPRAYLLCALLTPWTRALHERMSGGALLRAVLFSPSLREMAFFFFLTEGNPPLSQTPQRRGAGEMRLAVI